MSEASVCRNCGASVRLPAVACWMCQAPLVAIPAPAAQRPRDDASSALGLIAVVLVALVLAVIFVALLSEAPGLAVGYAVLVVPLVGGLSAIAFAVRTRASAAPAAGVPLDARGDVRPSTQSSWLDSAAKAMVIVIAILVGMAALGMAAIVILGMVCAAMLGGMH